VLVGGRDRRGGPIPHDTREAGLIGCFFLSVDSNIDDINQDWAKKKIGRCVRSESELDLWQRKVRIQWRG
jgi:hypothetical protein